MPLAGFEISSGKAHGQGIQRPMRSMVESMLWVITPILAVITAMLAFIRYISSATVGIDCSRSRALRLCKNSV